MKTKVFKIKSKSGSEILISNATLKPDEKVVNISIVDESGCVVGESIEVEEIERLIAVFAKLIDKEVMFAISVQ